MSAPTTYDPRKHLTKVSGRDYLEVSQRLVWLRSAYPDAVITTELVEHRGNMAIFAARVTLPNGATGSGYGQEEAGDFADYLEKAETKALGRALATAGFGTQFADGFEAAPRPATGKIDIRRRPSQAAPEEQPAPSVGQNRTPTMPQDAPEPASTTQDTSPPPNAPPRRQRTRGTANQNIRANADSAPPEETPRTAYDYTVADVNAITAQDTDQAGLDALRAADAERAKATGTAPAQPIPAPGEAPQARPARAKDSDPIPEEGVDRLMAYTMDNGLSIKSFYDVLYAAVGPTREDGTTRNQRKLDALKELTAGEGRRLMRALEAHVKKWGSHPEHG